MTKIVFNGREYSSIEDMPRADREIYEKAMAAMPDVDRNGIPDIADGALGAFAGILGHDGRGGSATGTSFGSEAKPKMMITVNGTQYHSLEEMPAEVREVYQRAMGVLDSNGDGVPDFLQTGKPPSILALLKAAWRLPSPSALERDMAGSGSDLRGGPSGNTNPFARPDDPYANPKVESARFLPMIMLCLIAIGLYLWLR